jgi:hypothetical protein
MNNKQRDILIGLILGDGYLTPFQGDSRKSSLDMKANQKELGYLKWLHSELSSLGVSALKKRKDDNQYRFVTRRLEQIGCLRQIFYPKGKKIIPKNIAEYLKSPITIAVWYQDDGTLDSRAQYHHNALIATHCFSFKHCELLTQALKVNFNLDVRVCRCLMRKKIYYRLYITSQSMDQFMALIKPYIQPCFANKIRSRAASSSGNT